MRPTPRLVGRQWFDFILCWILRHAHRYTHFVAVVTIRASREHLGLTIDGGVQMLTEVAERIGPMVRDSDLVGELDEGRLAILLPDGDDVAASCVVSRLGEALAGIQFAQSMVFAIGAASCPDNGIDMASLVAHATDHPALSIRAGSSCCPNLAQVAS